MICHIKIVLQCGHSHHVMGTVVKVEMNLNMIPLKNQKCIKFVSNLTIDESDLNVRVTYIN